MSYTVAVRALCEFTAKVGDLDLRFTPSPSAQEGMLGHRTVASRRSAHYQSEVALEGGYQQLSVRGRADGYDPDRNVLEEVKTYRGDLDAQPANHRQLHWAQAKVYGWLMCSKLGLPEIGLALVYFDIVSERETVINQLCPADELEKFFNQQCALFLGWAEQQAQQRLARDTAARALAFPHADFRLGQRTLAESVYKAVSTGRCLMAQAPTGIGKTIGTVFPMLKALAPQQLDKLFFLTAKTPGRKLALDAVRVLHASADLPLRALELVARDKACEHLDKACHGDSCPLAKGFYDRLPAAREAAAKVRLLDQPTLREVALAHEVCPYYLSQEMARWCDMVVADYNYYFDFGAMLFGLAQLNQWRVAVLVDEAHNLVERGRAMYSADLDQFALKSVRDSAPEPLHKPLQRLNREWNALHKEQVTVYQAYASKPEKLLQALALCTSAMGEYFNDHPQALTGELQSFYFEALQFAKVAELFNEQFIFDISQRDPLAKRRFSRLSLRNVVPAEFIRPRLTAARSSVLFSATLSPPALLRRPAGVAGGYRVD